MTERKKRSFLICPVRGASDDVAALAKETVGRLEDEGYVVHFPPRDTDQSDATGLRICRDNMSAIMAADVVHVVWDGKSQGSLFDLGVAFALCKMIEPIELPPETPHKSFQNMMRAWARGE